MKNKQNNSTNISNVIYQLELFYLYKNLLTKRQIKYYEFYYEKNLTYTEIAKLFKISRAAVGDNIMKTKLQLNQYEKKLKLYYNKQKRLELFKDIKDTKIKNKLLELEN